MQILPGQPVDRGAEEVAVTSVVADVKSFSDLSPFAARCDPLLAIRLKEKYAKIGI